MAEETGRPTPVHDPTVLRAIAHPVRNRVLGELSAAGHLRAADVAVALGIPANQASFHLRQLAKYGLVEPAPEHARDGRDRVWKPVHESGINLRLDDAELDPGGKAAVTVWRRQATAAANDAVNRAFARHDDDPSVHVMINDEWVRLTKAESAEYANDLLALQERWRRRTQGEDAPGRRTYHLLQILQPGPDPTP